MKHMHFIIKNELYFGLVVDYVEEEPVGKRDIKRKKLSQIVKDRGISIFNPTVICPGNSPCFLLFLAVVLAILCQGAWNTLPPISPGQLFLVLEDSRKSLAPVSSNTSSLLPVPAQIDLWYAGLCYMHLLHHFHTPFWSVFSITQSAVWGNESMKW